MESYKEIEITGTLDLHHFQPREIIPLIDEYLRECLKSSIFEGRIIHGKGTGTLKRTVQSHLQKHPLVEDYWNGDQTSGGWGATCFSLITQKDSRQDNLQDA